MHSPHSVRIVVPSFLADDMVAYAHSAEDHVPKENDYWRAPRVSDLDLASGDLREHAFARPLGVRKCEVLACERKPVF